MFVILNLFHFFVEEFSYMSLLNVGANQIREIFQTIVALITFPEILADFYFILVLYGMFVFELGASVGLVLAAACGDFLHFAHGVREHILLVNGEQGVPVFFHIVQLFRLHK